jgi:hypothetical protein
MKKQILILTLIFTLVGCSINDDSYITLKGRVEREINGEGISNQKVLLEIHQIHGTGNWQYTTKVDSKEVTIYEYESPILKFSFPSFPNLGIWTKVGAPFICLEPWLGYSDTLDTNGILLEKEGIQILEPLSSKSYQYNISIL